MLTEEQVNEIINGQEECIADLRQKLLEMEDLRDLAVGKGLELVKAMRRIECSEYPTTDNDMREIARTAIDSYQAK